MILTKCPDCEAEIEIPDDVMVGEIIECSDCGLELEVEKIEANQVEIQRLSIEKEDWGE
jgi:alpha-aminoadipate carrier protein LysW